MSEVRLLNNFEKFLIITWKNMNILCNHRWKTALSVMMPCMFALIMVLLRTNMNAEFRAIAEYEPVDFDVAWNRMIFGMELKHKKIRESNAEIKFTCFIPNLTLAYAPNGNHHTELVKYANSKYLNNTVLAAYKTEDELREAMSKQHYLAGIYFNELPVAKLHQSNETKSMNLDFSIIFPSELRIFHDIIISKGWETNRRFAIGKWKPETANDGGYLGYIREGFASIQNAISMSFIEIVLLEQNLPVVKAQRFAENMYTYDPILCRVHFGLPIVIMVGYLYPCTNLIKQIVKEKEIRVRDVLRVLGINKELEYSCWFANKLPLMMISTLIVTTIIKTRWFHGSGILSNSSWWLIFLFLTSYNVASIGFCYMISSTTTKAIIAVIFMGVIWFLSYLPYLALKAQADQELSKLTYWMMLIFPNTSMAIGFNIILDFEESAYGLQWKNLFDSNFLQHKLSIGFIVISQLCLGVIYMFVGLYMTKLAKSISKLYLYSYHLILAAHNQPKPPKTDSRRSNIRKTKILEIEPAHKKVSIELKELNKHVLGGEFIKNVSVCIYEGEITVIMGHNASGKTLLLSLIAGIFKPSSGYIVYDEKEGLKDVYDDVSMAYCINNILFPDLTVSNQIMFFCRLKGLMGDALKEEVQKYLAAMDLTKVADMFTRDLTDGQQQHLSACCALCGNSKYVLLDEPSTGMDLGSRKMLWDLLLNEKRNRTIVITSQSTEEADILADRLLILSGGELMCSGSIQFLNTVYGQGFRLICVKDTHCDTENVTEFLRQYLHNIQPESDIGCELSYRLKEHNPKIFSKLLADLEDSFFQLQLTSCSISSPTAEDIFMRMGSENPSEHDRTRLYEIMNGYSIFVEEYEKLSFAKNYKTYTGMKLIISQWRAMITKRFFYHKNRKKIIILQIFMPALVTFLTYLMRNSDYHREPLPRMVFSQKLYPDSALIIDSHHGLRTEDFREEYERFRDYYYQQSSMMGTTYFYEETGTKTISEFVVEKQKTDENYWQKYICGASYRGTEVIAWFNYYPLHGMPLSLTLAHNALIRLKNHTSTITVMHAPLPYQTYLDPDAIEKTANFGNIYASNLVFIISFVFTFCMNFTIHERIVRFKLLQYMHGMRPFTFFASSLTFEFLKIIIVAILVIVVMFFFEQSAQTLHSKANCFQAIVVFGICITPFYYLVSLIFKDYVNGYAVATMFNLYGVAVFVVWTDGFQDVSPTNKAMWIWLSHILPHFALGKVMSKIYYIDTNTKMCSNLAIKSYNKEVDDCQLGSFVACCADPWDNFSIHKELQSLLVLGILSTLVLFLTEYQVAQGGRWFYRIPRDNLKLEQEEYTRIHSDDSYEIDGVLNEKLRIHYLKSAYVNVPLIISRMGKIYGDRIAVNRISLMVERCECLAVLGANGSGKSLIMKMLVGEVEMSFGRVFVNGISLTDDIFGMFKQIGYNPQISAMPINLTIHQTLYFFCRVRGIPKEHIADICECLCKVLGIFKHYDKVIARISPGIKRRLSSAIAMIGNPSLLLFDCVLSSVDPAGRRQIWNLISRLCKRGKAVFIATIYAGECDYFARRFAYIVNGKMQCIDTAQNLNKKYIRGYILKVKLRAKTRYGSTFTFLSTHSNIQMPTFSNSTPVFKLMSFVEQHFPNSIIKDQRGAIFYFLIPRQEITLSQIFRKMHRHSFSLNIEHFSITRDTLSMVFVDFTEIQREERQRTAHTTDYY